jgi:uncharacterized protein
MATKTKLVVIAAFVIVAGCSPLAPQPDRSKYYILTPLSGEHSTAARIGVNRQLTIGIGPIEFPDYLRRAEVVTRTAPNRIHLSDEARWAEPLDKNFKRILTENLARLLHTQRIETYPWNRRNHVDYQIVIDVQRFETTADGQSQLIARWIIKDGEGGKDLYASETSASTPLPAGDDGASEALSSDLGQLSTEIASHVTELSQRRSIIGGNGIFPLQDFSPSAVNLAVTCSSVA